MDPGPQHAAEGVLFINEWAVEEKLADPKVLVADTTAQELAKREERQLVG